MISLDKKYQIEVSMSGGSGSSLRLTNSIGAQALLSVGSVFKGDKGERGEQGSAGPEGGASLSFVYQAAISISGHRAVTVDSDGRMIYATNDIASHALRVLGVSTNAASAGDIVNVRKCGEVIEPSWNWDVSRPVYLGSEGNLTQTPPISPGSIFQLALGFPISPTALFINIGIPITLIA